MQFVQVLLLIAVLAVACLSQEIEEGVLVLTDDNFEKTVADTEFLLVEFYAPWCGHCKSLAPEYAKAATKLAADGSEVKLAKMDATEHKAHPSKFDVKGFPTLKFFRSGVASDYNGGRTSEDITAWLSKKTGPVATTVASTEEYEHMQEANDVFVIGAFADANSDAAKLFLDAAATLEATTFAITSDASVRSNLGVTGDAILVIKTFDDLRNDLEVTAATDKAAISDFVSGHSVPIIQVFNDETSGKIFKSAIQKHTLFFTDSTAPHHAPTVEAFTTAGKALRGQTLMINVQESQTRVAEYFGLKPSDFPACVFADMSSSNGMKKFPMSGDVTDAANIESFLTKAMAGELTPTLKSEEASPEDTAGDVIVVKGTTFKELVIDNDKDVMVEFYAPWCGHCKSLAPEYDELGAALAGNPNVVIAKMDSTANEIDVDGVDVKGFPTLMFFKGNQKPVPIKYEEGRTKDEILAFIQKNAHHEIGELAAGAAGDDEDDEDDEREEPTGDEL
jgi:protein disulfide-isomerase A1